MGRYTEAHAKPQGVGDARPTALQIIKDEGVENKLTGKVIVITGASSGIGVETARALATTGATLYLTVRDKVKAEENLKDILGNGRTFLIDMDLSSFASVKAAASAILQKSGNKVNILVNNAGILGIQTRTLSEDGHELHFATNHLAHFLLFQLLKTALLASSTPEFSSRVVNLSSSASRASKLLPSDNYNFEKSDYDFNIAYASSKLANVYMASEIERRYGHLGLHATAVHPGGIHTGIGRHVDPKFVEAIYADEKLLKWLKNPEQGAATTVWAAVGKEWEGKGGKYLEDCSESEEGPDDSDMFGTGYVPQTYNEAEEERLWKDSVKMVGLEDDA
ncbi:putative short-chain dehydrogenase/reductase [Lophiostoma macrostomum CBS 122681]|uniref:Putative short-chain dehydrogenase/reductase n=1 Tax=Lophiostoma macrostomum CBS 122681 TaxID=1314788 RepID=A0A6A6SNQ4_9PLEO|nr:putative short-chain dehydrogenase/reductase [Lophiostoma macrostomum CBS 122681]